jgi:hypothetical protein
MIVLNIIESARGLIGTKGLTAYFKLKELPWKKERVMTINYHWSIYERIDMENIA